MSARTMFRWFNKHHLSHGRCKGSPECEACQSTLNMERVCSLSSPDSSLSTSSSASLQSSASPCKRPNRYYPLTPTPTPIPIHVVLMLHFKMFYVVNTRSVKDVYLTPNLRGSLGDLCVYNMCWSVFSMSEDEQEGGCDTVDGSPASDSSGRADSPFLESNYITDRNENCKAHVTTEKESGKPPVRTMVVPPMRVQNNNEPLSRTGKYT